MRYSPRWLKFRNRNRHRPGWRFLPFILIVTVYPKICNVSVIGMCLTSFRRIGCTAHRLWQRLFCPNPYQWAWLFHYTTAKPSVARDFDKFFIPPGQAKNLANGEVFYLVHSPQAGASHRFNRRFSHFVRRGGMVTRSLSQSLWSTFGFMAYIQRTCWVRICFTIGSDSNISRKSYHVIRQ